MSLQIAYLKLITDAKHFIYIENQFFISSHAGAPVVNEISKAIVKRI
jgi:phospholipase D1/2